ncbi:MAG: hypothetical protein DRO88_04385 [Promethearchaeia archaeon]|nr:MAG: hypothetical protein DRO88_04385 [Candidatus Lokiarchaeia archaeon]
MKKLNILLFPTRFYPAISGGDFLLERLGREFLRISKRSDLERLNLQEMNVKVLTSNAIDFGALRGNGRIIDTKHRYFSHYKNLDIYRYKSYHNSKNNSNRTQKQNLFEKLGYLTNLYVPEFASDLNPLIENGPILSELIDDLYFKRFEKKLPFIPQIIHCTYFPYLNILYSLLIARYFEIPACITPFLHFANIRYQNEVFYSILQEFDLIFACTNYEKQVLLSHGIKEKQIVVMPMGVDAQRFNQENYQEIFLKVYNPQKPLILFCGYKNFEKGALTLLKIIPYLDKKYKKCSIVFIGPSTTAFNYEMTNLKKIIKNVQIINISPENLAGMYDKKKIGVFQLADIYCMPSRSDAYGIAFLEAWATGTPVIAAKIPAMQEVVNEKKDGLLVEFDSIEELIQAISTLIENPSLRTEMGIAGQKKVLKNNNWTEIAVKTLQNYQEIIENHKKIKFRRKLK